eukprot:3467991-Alexandrium_andersonii.AAC.1
MGVGESCERGGLPGQLVLCTPLGWAFRALSFRLQLSVGFSAPRAALCRGAPRWRHCPGRHRRPTWEDVYIE